MSSIQPARTNDVSSPANEQDFRSAFSAAVSSSNEHSSKSSEAQESKKKSTTAEPAASEPSVLQTPAPRLATPVIASQPTVASPVAANADAGLEEAQPATDQFKPVLAEKSGNAAFSSYSSLAALQPVTQSDMPRATSPKVYEHEAASIAGKAATSTANKSSKTASTCANLPSSSKVSVLAAIPQIAAPTADASGAASAADNGISGSNESSDIVSSRTALASSSNFLTLAALPQIASPAVDGFGAAKSASSTGASGANASSEIASSWTALPSSPNLSALAAVRRTTTPLADEAGDRGSSEASIPFSAARDTSAGSASPSNSSTLTAIPRMTLPTANGLEASAAGEAFDAVVANTSPISSTRQIVSPSSSKPSIASAVAAGQEVSKMEPIAKPMAPAQLEQTAPQQKPDASTTVAPSGVRSSADADADAGAGVSHAADGSASRKPAESLTSGTQVSGTQVSDAVATATQPAGTPEVSPVAATPFADLSSTGPVQVTYTSNASAPMFKGVTPVQTAPPSGKGKTTSSGLFDKQTDKQVGDSAEDSQTPTAGSALAGDARIVEAAASGNQHANSGNESADTPALQQTNQPSQVEVSSHGQPASSDATATPATHAQASGAAAATDLQTSSGVSSAQLIQSINHSEMRLGMQSAEFGNISISTSLNHQALSAQISIDHSELGRALAVHLPAIEEKLGNAYGVHARVEVRDGGSASSYSNSGQQAKDNRQAQSGGGSTSAAPGFERTTDQMSDRMSAFTSSPTPSMAAGTSRLDIRI